MFVCVTTIRPDLPYIYFWRERSQRWRILQGVHLLDPHLRLLKCALSNGNVNLQQHLKPIRLNREIVDWAHMDLSVRLK